MRKQYHFWPGSIGRDAWDVDRLIELSRNLPVTDVDISSIAAVDTPYWFDEPASVTVRNIVEQMRLVREVETQYPIILGPDARLMDGMHRVARAMLEGRTTIRAVRFAALPEPDFRSCRAEDLNYDREVG